MNTDVFKEIDMSMKKYALLNDKKNLSRRRRPAQNEEGEGRVPDHRRAGVTRRHRIVMEDEVLDTTFQRLEREVIPYMSSPDDFNLSLEDVIDRCE